jgi:tight adherence protein C
MTLGLVLLSSAAAILLLQWWNAANPSRIRMMRLVPPLAAEENGAAGETPSHAALRRVLGAMDPSFTKIEPMLRSLGVVSVTWMLAIQAGRIAGALLAAFLSAEAAGMLIANPLVKFLVPLLALVGFIWCTNKLIRIVSLNRRRQIRKEMALGIEIFCIFLEGGQSLDQSFRSFGDICGQALPHLADIQRTLIADIDNGLSYEKAIERWADNLGIEEARPLSALFIDSLVHGTELVPHLRQFSADLVEQRIVGARTSIGVKSSQLTVVMVLFFLPAILVFLIAPAAIALVTTLGMR